MSDQFPHIFLLILAIGLWLYGSFPLLRYTIDAAERKFHWKLILWLVLMIIAIFVIKFSLFALTGKPEPGTWLSRLFFGALLFLSIFVPFGYEYLKKLFRRK